MQFKSAFFSRNPLPLPPCHLLGAWASHERGSLSHLTPSFEKAQPLSLYTCQTAPRYPPPDLHRQPQEVNLLLLGISENYSPLSLLLIFISLALRMLFTRQWVHRGNAQKLSCTQGSKKDPLGLADPSGQEVPLWKSSRRPYITTPLEWQAINGNTIISIKYVGSLWCSLF